MLATSLRTTEVVPGPSSKESIRGMQRFALHAAPAFRAANGTPTLELKVLQGGIDRFSTEQTGKQYFRFTVSVVNYDQLPQDMFPFQVTWDPHADHPSDPPEISPIQVGLFEIDGEQVTAWEDPTRSPWRPASMKKDLEFSSTKDDLPDKVYLLIYDNRHDKVYRSDLTPFTPSVQVPEQAPATRTPPPHLGSKK